MLPIIYGGVAGPDLISVAAGPAEDPDPEIHAPDHIQEVYDCESFYWDPTANGGDGAWSTPVFSHSIGNNGIADEDDFSFGWEWVRATRDQLLAACDQRVPLMLQKVLVLLGESIVRNLETSQLHGQVLVLPLT